MVKLPFAFSIREPSPVIPNCSSFPLIKYPSTTIDYFILLLKLIVLIN
jgi:hypothetical protein